MDLHGLVHCSLLVLLELVLLAGKVLPDVLHRERSSADFEYWTGAKIADEHRGQFLYETINVLEWPKELTQSLVIQQALYKGSGSQNFKIYIYFQFNVS